MAFGIDDALMILGPLLAAGGSYGGAATAARGGNSNDIRRNNPDPIRDPLLSGLSVESLLGIGSTAGLTGFLDDASPNNQMIDSIMRSDQLTDKQKRRAVNAIHFFTSNGLDPTDPTNLNKLKLSDGTVVTREEYVGLPAEQKAGATWLVPPNIRKIQGEIGRAVQTVGYGGYSNWGDLQAAEQAYRQRSDQFQAQVAPLADTIRMNRIQGISNLADIAGNAGLRTEELASLYEPQIARQFQEQRDQVLQAANAGRYNPGAALGRLAESEALTKRTGAIERALQILGGQASITKEALSPAQVLASQTSAQRQGVNLNLANIGAAQANAQQQLSQQQSDSLGSGIAGAGANLSNAALLYAILNQGRTGGPAAQPSGAGAQDFDWSRVGQSWSRAPY